MINEWIALGLSAIVAAGIVYLLFILGLLEVALVIAFITCVVITFVKYGG